MTCRTSVLSGSDCIACTNLCFLSRSLRTRSSWADWTCAASAFPLLATILSSSAGYPLVHACNTTIKVTSCSSRCFKCMLNSYYMRKMVCTSSISVTSFQRSSSLKHYHMTSQAHYSHSRRGLLNKCIVILAFHADNAVRL